MHPITMFPRPKPLAGWLCLIGLLAGCAREGGEGGIVVATQALRPLDLAWTFASAIDNDPDDRATYQRHAALARLEAGDLRMALAQGRRIADWNRGMVLARSAEAVARQGNPAEAQALLLEAEAVAKTAEEGWQADRIRLASGSAVVLIGATNGLAWLEGQYKDRPEYGGQVTAVRALQKGRQGQWAEALADVDAIPATHAFDSVAWKARGFGLLAREASASNPDAATNALARMWDAAGQVPGPLGVELRLDGVDIALRALEASRASGGSLVDHARGRVKELEEAVVAANSPPHVLLPLKLRVAKSVARLGDGTHAKEVVAGLLPACRTDVMPIESPALLADAGEALALAGDGPAAEAVFQEAVSAAVALRNRRPRCLALCDIALRLEAGGLPDGPPLEALRAAAAVLEGR